MNQLAIRAERLGKRYRYGPVQTGLLNLRETLADGAQLLTRRLAGSLSGGKRVEEAKPRNFWAIRNLSFEVARGDVVGIVGRNGAGKSTLLKILSRVTEPTEGHAEVHGRVGSLLEVGTGFHPELTGRENVFLNGAILGMRRAEISRRFDEIVAFAEVAPFIDTPVKFYSSGMYLRLAFAVAAHLEPEILVVDEVLAVGDAAFQNKCVRRMSKVASEGRTVLFVSHNLAAVQKLCTRAILIRDGTAAADGPVHEVVASYLAGLEKPVLEDLRERRDRGGEGRVRLVGIETYIEDRPSEGLLVTGRPARLLFRVDGVLPGISITFTIYDDSGRPVTYFDSLEHRYAPMPRLKERSAVRCDIDDLPLVPGRYRLNVAISCDGALQDHVEGATFLQVEQGVLQGFPVTRSQEYGSVIINHRWTNAS